MRNTEWKFPLFVLAVIFAVGLYLCPRPGIHAAAGATGRPIAARVASTNTKSVVPADNTEDWRSKFLNDPIEWFTLVLAVATCFLWWDTNGLRRLGIRQAEQMQESLGIARDSLTTTRNAFEQEFRPWVSVTAAEVVSPLTWTTNGARLSVRFTLKNYGRSPAVNVLADWRLLGCRPLRPEKVQDEMLAWSVPGSARTVFPNEEQQLAETRNQHEYIEVLQTTVLASWGEPPPVTTPRTAVTVVGYVVYMFPDLKEFHRTGFVYELLAPISTETAINQFEIGVDVPADRLLLRDIRDFHFRPLVS